MKYYTIISLRMKNIITITVNPIKNETVALINLIKSLFSKKELYP